MVFGESCLRRGLRRGGGLFLWMGWAILSPAFVFFLHWRASGSLAPEFYDTLKYHSSWSRLLFQFIFDKRYSLYSRIERTKQRNDSSRALPRTIKDPINGVALTATTNRF